MNQLLRITLSFFLFIWISNLYAQISIGSIDLKKIKQKKVRRFLRDQQEKKIEYFTELEISVNDDEELYDFMEYEKVYEIKQDVGFVWDNYLYSSQTDIWDLNKISFALLFDQHSESIIYANQNYYGLKKGQIFYLNLKILNGFYNLPVAFKIVDVGTNHIEFSYLEGGKTRGKQIIHLEETEQGYTRIIHRSFVKSHSKIRDKYLYPYFHNKLINEFHSNMRRMITKQSKSGEKLLAEKSK